MKNSVTLNDMQLTANGVVDDNFLESVFFTGNGRVGIRGYPAIRQKTRPSETGLFIAGVFDEWKPGITDIVNLPTPIWHEIKINGYSPDNIGNVSRTLDMSSGILTFEYIMRQEKSQLHVKEERLLPFFNPANIQQRTTFCPDSDMTITVTSGVELQCCNLPIPDDQMKDSSETIRLLYLEPPSFEKSSMALNGKTLSTEIEFQLKIVFEAEHFKTSTPFFQENEFAGITFQLNATSRKEYYLNKSAIVTTSRDCDPLIDASLPYASWEDCIKQSGLDWQSYWSENGIEIEGDAEAQAALRYSMFQLRCNCSPRDPTVSIGARGLTHARYKGCYFWDTDFFMLPFFLLTDPTAAKNLIQYRINTLPQAKDHARKMNSSGARFPWMVSYDGSEQCETWDIGCSELHITADIAYAVGQYLDYTDDQIFLYKGCAELLVNTARFWVSRYSHNPITDGINLLWCKGPDEYCGVTHNNLFTNKMVQHNLTLAVNAAQTLQQNDSRQYNELGLSPSECDAWLALRDAIPLPRDPNTGRYQTDETFHLMEPLDISTIKHGDKPCYHSVSFDRLQRYKVVKQADVLLLMSRLTQSFSKEERLMAWEDFEPICVHDSTLSFASHAFFAFQNGLLEPGGVYLKKALFLDLNDIMSNTGKEGLHLACMGESWQAIVFGIAGLTLYDEEFFFKPNLPVHWKALTIRIMIRGIRYKVCISSGNVEITKL